MNEKQPNFLRSLTGALDLPNELIFNLPRLIMTSNEEVYIENYRGIVSYSETEIRLNTTKMPVKITGSGLGISRIAAEEITVKGQINAVEFLR